MKLNLPVTGKERTFSKDEDLITTTDLKGAITYYNDNFLHISGFDGEELSHKNHNVVRHPDMPPAAFDDLWKTIKSGKSWMGIVKNRCKNGDHYYVDAYVSPISSAGQVAEYQSVRTVPDREHVERAEGLYKRIRAGKSPIMPWHHIGGTLKLMAGFCAVLLLALGYVWIKFNPPLGELAAVALFGLGISYGFARLINGPLSKLAAASRLTLDNAIARQVYGGSQDEIAQLQLVMHMKDLQINSIVARLNDVSGQLTDIVQTTSRMAQEASDGVAVQQSEITQLASAMTEMVATVQEVARNTSDAADSAQNAEREVVSSRQEVMATVQSISQVAEDVKQASGVVSKVQEESVHIGAVLDVIRGIAEQTNLLALNAAIEAARAGEQGRGFAVVADEVRSLARRTQESTQEIQAMIESIQSGASDAVSAMDAGRNRVDASVEQAQKAGGSLDRIAEIVGSISTMNIQVASATEEQGAVSEEINRNVNNISGAAEENASRSHDTQLTVDQLSGFSNHVQTLVAQFRRG